MRAFIRPALVALIVAGTASLVMAAQPAFAQAKDQAAQAPSQPPELCLLYTSPSPRD